MSTSLYDIIVGKPDVDKFVACETPFKIPEDQVILSSKDLLNPCLKDAEWLFDYDTPL